MSPLLKTALGVQDLRVVVKMVVGWVPDRAGHHIVADLSRCSKVALHLNLGV